MVHSYPSSDTILLLLVVLIVLLIQVQLWEICVYRNGADLPVSAQSFAWDNVGQNGRKIMSALESVRRRHEKKKKEKY